MIFTEATLNCSILNFNEEMHLRTSAEMETDITAEYDVKGLKIEEISKEMTDLKTAEETFIVPTKADIIREDIIEEKFEIVMKEEKVKDVDKLVQLSESLDIQETIPDIAISSKPIITEEVKEDVLVFEPLVSQGLLSEVSQLSEPVVIDESIISVAPQKGHQLDEDLVRPELIEPDNITDIKKVVSQVSETVLTQDFKQNDSLVAISKVSESIIEEISQVSEDEAFVSEKEKVVELVSETVIAQDIKREIVPLADKEPSEIIIKDEVPAELITIISKEKEVPSDVVVIQDGLHVAFQEESIQIHALEEHPSDIIVDRKDTITQEIVSKDEILIKDEKIKVGVLPTMESESLEKELELSEEISMPKIEKVKLIEESFESEEKVVVSALEDQDIQYAAQIQGSFMDTLDTTGQNLDFEEIVERKEVKKVSFSKPTVMPCEDDEIKRLVVQFAGSFDETSGPSITEPVLKPSESEILLEEVEEPISKTDVSDVHTTLKTDLFNKLELKEDVVEPLSKSPVEPSEFIREDEEKSEEEGEQQYPPKETEYLEPKLVPQYSQDFSGPEIVGVMMKEQALAQRLDEIEPSKSLIDVEPAAIRIQEIQEDVVKELEDKAQYVVAEPIITDEEPSANLVEPTEVQDICPMVVYAMPEDESDHFEPHLDIAVGTSGSIEQLLPTVSTTLKDGDLIVKEVVTSDTSLEGVEEAEAVIEDKYDTGRPITAPFP